MHGYKKIGGGGPSYKFVFRAGGGGGGGGNMPVFWVFFGILQCEFNNLNFIGVRGLLHPRI